MAYRDKKLANLIKKEISSMLLKGVKDPRISQFSTITDVTLTKDLRYATVYVSVFGNFEEKKLSMEGFNSAKGYIKLQLGKKIKVKYMPEIVFKLDESIEKGINFYHRIEEIIEEDKKKGLIKDDT